MKVVVLQAEREGMGVFSWVGSGEKVYLTAHLQVLTYRFEKRLKGATHTCTAAHCHLGILKLWILTACSLSLSFRPAMGAGGLSKHSHLRLFQLIMR